MHNLTELNMACKEKLDTLEPYELIEKILPSKEQINELGMCLTNFYNWNDWDAVYDIKEAVTIFLVGCAKYYYNDRNGGFWDAVKRLAHIKDSNKNNIIKAFNSTLSLHFLDKFEKEKVQGYTQMGAILAHAGLPEGLEDGLIKLIAGLQYEEIPFERLGEECIENSIYSPESLVSYLSIIDKLGTINDFVYDVIQLLKGSSNEIDDSLSISESLQQKIIGFRRTDFASQKNNTNQKYSFPVLSYDTNSNFIYIEIPELKSSSSSKLKVVVKNGDETIYKNLYENGYIGNGYTFRSSVLKIEPKKNIEVSLFDDLDKEIWNHQLKNENECILFNLKGEFVRGRTLPNKGGFVLIDNDYNGKSGQELLNSYDETNLFVQPETDLDNAIFESQEQIIKLAIKKPTELIDGERLFGFNCKFQGLDAYYDLPKIKLPISGEWKLTIHINDLKFSRNLTTTDTIISLEEIVNNDSLNSKQFGKISVGLLNKDIGYKAFRFLYLPYVERKISSYLPGPDGFRKSNVTFNVRNENIKILDTNLKETKVLGCKEDEEFVNGVYQYKDNNYPFSIMIRPYGWKMENNEDILFQPNTMGFLSLSDISKSGDCILTLKNNTDEKIYLKIDNQLTEPKALPIGQHNKRIISMKEYFEYISSAENEVLIYIESNFEKVCDICSFRINLAIKNMSVLPFSRDYYFISWEEDGLKKNRELRCRYLDRPFDYFVLPVNDGQILVSIDMNDERFKVNFIAEVALKREKNIFDIEGNEKIDLLDSHNSIKVDYFQEIPPYTNFDVKQEQEFNDCIYSFLTYRFNGGIFTDKNLYGKTLSKLLIKIISARIWYGDEKIIEALSKYNLDSKKFNQLVNDFRLYAPIIKNEPISRNTYRQLEKYNPFLYVIYSLMKVEWNQVDEITADNMAYLTRFVDKENFMFSHKYQIFNDIDKIDILQNRFQNVLSLFKNQREEGIYLMVLVEFIINNTDKFKNTSEDIKLISKLSGYIKNLSENYPKATIMEFFKQINGSVKNRRE